MSDGDRSVVIRKDTVGVELRTSSGSTEVGEVFLRPIDASSRAERLVDILAERAFVPLRQEDKLILFATPHIVWARIDLLAAIDELDPDAEDDATGVKAEVEVTLAHAPKLTGTLRYALPAQSRRLADYLERAPAFFPLRTGDWVYLVRLANVVSIRPIAEAR